MTEIGLFDAMYTARALRRLKPDPVPEELITMVLDAAIRAPSGGNAQNWISIVIREEAQRRRLAAVYRKASDEIAEIYAARGQPAHLTDAQYQRLMAGGSYLWDHIDDAPVLLVPCLKKRDMPPRIAGSGSGPIRSSLDPSGEDSRFKHRSGDTEHHPGVPRAWSGKADHYQPHPV